MNIHRIIWPLTLLILFVIDPADTLIAQYRIHVHAGAFDRLNSIISVHFPASVDEGVYQMESNKGQIVHIQVDSENTGRFLLKKLEEGSSVEFSLDTTDALVGPFSQAEAVSVSLKKRTADLSVGGKNVLSYYVKNSVPPSYIDQSISRGGYIHPLYSPSGIPLTAHMDSSLHPHHLGVWSPWTNIKFNGNTPDFWNLPEGTAKIYVSDTLDAIQQGPVFGGLTNRHYYADISDNVPVAALNEQWKVTVYQLSENSGYRLIDLQLVQTTNTSNLLILPEYHYGGMAFRGHTAWNNPDNVSFVTSEGFNRQAGNETRARWAAMWGTINGQKAGVAILGHPSNPRAPQPIRIHPETPYFVFAPVQLGEMVIRPGDPYRATYRFITFDGEPDIEQIDQLWKNFAYPPTAFVEIK